MLTLEEDYTETLLCPLWLNLSGDRLRWSQMKNVRSIINNENIVTNGQSSSNNGP